MTSGRLVSPALDYKKELELEQKRQQLQRELSQLAEEEVENITIQKKVGPRFTAAGSPGLPQSALVSYSPWLVSPYLCQSAITSSQSTPTSVSQPLPLSVSPFLCQ